MEKQLIASAYYRTSTVLMGQDINNQREPVRSYCKQRGLALVPDHEYADEGFSGAKRRPGMERLLKDAKSGKFQVLVTVGLDRVARDLKMLLQFMETLDEAGVRLISLREQIDLSQPSGRLIMQVIGAIAEFERQLIRTRIKEALAAKKLIAERTGSAWRCGPKTKVTDEVAREILQLRAQGLSIRAIELRLDRRISRGSIGRVVQANEGAAPPRPKTSEIPGLHYAEIAGESFCEIGADRFVRGVQR